MPETIAKHVANWSIDKCYVFLWSHDMAYQCDNCGLLDNEIRRFVVDAIYEMYLTQQWLRSEGV